MRRRCGVVAAAELRGRARACTVSGWASAARPRPPRSALPPPAAMSDSSSRPYDADLPLAGRHAVVTGGGRGIGAAVADELARLGARLTLMGRGVDALRAQA